MRSRARTSPRQLFLFIVCDGQTTWRRCSPCLPQDDGTVAARHGRLLGEHWGLRAMRSPTEELIAMMRPATIHNPVPLAPDRVYAAPTPADATRRFPVFMRCSHFFLALSMSRCEPQKWPVGHESETQRCCTTPNSSSVPSTSSSSMNTTGQSFAYLRAASSTDWNCGVTNAICSTLANGNGFAPSHSDGASALPQAMYMSS